MKLVCPSCGFFASPDAFLGEGDAQRALLLAFNLPAQLAAPLHQYLRLFRPLQRALTARRVESLLAELLPLIEAARIERRGRVWPAPVESWRAGLEEIVSKRDRLTLPLRSHGYLLEIIAGHADKAAASAETQREQERAYAYRTERGTDGPAPVAAVIAQQAEKTPMPEHLRARLKEFGIRNKPAKEAADAAE